MPRSSDLANRLLEGPAKNLSNVYNFGYGIQCSTEHHNILRFTYNN